MDIVSKRLSGLKAFICCVILLLVGCQANANFIIDVTSSSDIVIDGMDGQIKYELINRGDEIGDSGIIGLNVPPGFTTNQVDLGTLIPNRTLSGVIPFEFPEDAPNGSYPAIINLVFTDGNQYPITMIFPQIISKGMRVSSKGLAKASDFNLIGNDQGILEVEVMNRDSVAHNILVVCHAPHSLKVKEAAKALMIGPRESVKHSFILSSFGALPDSDILILISTTYQDDKGMHSTITKTHAKILRPDEANFSENPLKVTSEQVIYLSASLMILFLFFRIYWKWNRE